MLIGGLNVPETLVFMGLAIFFLMFTMYNLLFIVGMLILMSWRFVNERNALYYFGVLIKYYYPAQTFARRI
jgi:hypothetical protein